MQSYINLYYRIKRVTLNHNNIIANSFTFIWQLMLAIKRTIVIAEKSGERVCRGHRSRQVRFAHSEQSRHQCGRDAVREAAGQHVRHGEEQRALQECRQCSQQGLRGHEADATAHGRPDRCDEVFGNEGWQRPLHRHQGGCASQQANNVMPANPPAATTPESRRCLARSPCNRILGCVSIFTRAEHEPTDGRWQRGGELRNQTFAHGL